jgi:hypothetical protein
MTFSEYLKARGETVSAFVARANKLRIRARPLGDVQFYRLLAGKDIHTSSLYRALEATRKEPARVRGKSRFVTLREVPVVLSA